jgi:nicotinate-nucleotide adenylyltransferase
MLYSAGIENCYLAPEKRRKVSKFPVLGSAFLRSSVYPFSFGMKIGLFFGSFNPVHVGHMIIANFMATQTDLDQVWLVVSPQNPLKPKSVLANDYDRLHLVKLAISENPHLLASNIEFGLPKPSFTIDTLTYLHEKYPAKQFVLIMGGDNLATLHKWKNYEILLRDYQIYLYRRPSYELGELENHPTVRTFDAPLLDISATYIRQCLMNGFSVQYLVPDAVYQYLESSQLYRL